MKETTLKQEILNDQEAYANAKERVEAKMGFYIHLAVYLIVNTFLVILNLTFTKEYFWAIWPIIGWGAGLIIHGFNTFVFTADSSLKKRLIEKEMKRRQ